MYVLILRSFLDLILPSAQLTFTFDLPIILGGKVACSSVLAASGRGGEFKHIPPHMMGETLYYYASMHLSPLVPGVATTRRDGSGAWRPSSRREAAPPPEVRSMTETSSEPSFVGAMLNMTVPVGRDVDLDCQVKNAEGFKVTNETSAFDFSDVTVRGFPGRPVQRSVHSAFRSSSHVPCRVPLPHCLCHAPAPPSPSHPSVVCLSEVNLCAVPFLTLFCTSPKFPPSHWRRRGAR